MTGSLHFFKGNIPGATAWFQKALKIFDEIGYKLGRVLIYNNLGVMYRLLSNNNEAIKNFLIALELKKEMGDKKGANNAALTSLRRSNLIISHY